MPEIVKIKNVNIPDWKIAEFARISHPQKKVPTKEDNIKLLQKLWDRGHFVPFEFQQIIFFVSTPLYTARQWMRHRTGSFIEKSLRYSKVNFLEVDAPEGSNYVLESILMKYNELIEQGIKPEDARKILPMGLYTKFYWRVDSRNLFHFLELRYSNHAQKNIRIMAGLILQQLKMHPYTQNLYKLYMKGLKK